MRIKYGNWRRLYVEGIAVSEIAEHGCYGGEGHGWEKPVILWILGVENKKQSRKTKRNNILKTLAAIRGSCVRILRSIVGSWSLMVWQLLVAALRTLCRKPDFCADSSQLGRILE